MTTNRIAKLERVELTTSGATLVIELSSERGAHAYMMALVAASEIASVMLAADAHPRFLPTVDRNGKLETGARIVFESDREITVRELHAIADGLQRANLDVSRFFELLKV